MKATREAVLGNRTLPNTTLHAHSVLANLVAWFKHDTSDGFAERIQRAEQWLLVNDPDTLAEQTEIVQRSV